MVTDSTHELTEETNLKFRCTPDERVTGFTSSLIKGALGTPVSMVKDAGGKFSDYNAGGAALSDAASYRAEVVYTYNAQTFTTESESITVAVQGKEIQFNTIVLYVLMLINVINVN